MGLLELGERFRPAKRTNKHKIKGQAAKRQTKITTTLDTLYEAVKDNKKLTLAQAAKMCDISPEKAEQWAKILDSRGMIELYYPAINAPILRIDRIQDKNNSKRIAVFAIVSSIVVVLIILILIYST
jgi:hypothetical protein